MVESQSLKPIVRVNRSGRPFGGGMEPSLEPEPLSYSGVRTALAQT
jgi:hypothetical protein